MKNYQLILLSSVIAIVMSSCSRNPKSCFTVHTYNSEGKLVSSNKGVTGETFFFDHLCSKDDFGGATYFEYGDGTKGAGFDSHIYNKPGTYTVKCVVYGAENGSKSEKSDVSSQTVIIAALQADASQKTTNNNQND